MIHTLQLPLSCFAAEQRTKLKELLLNEILLRDDVFRSHFRFSTMRKNNSWLAANGGKSANPATKQLITSPGAGNFKVKGLIEETKIVGSELNLHRDLGVSRNHPSMEESSSLIDIFLNIKIVQVYQNIY